MSIIGRIKRFYKRPGKHHLDIIAALLGIPLSITLLVLNVINLQQKAKPADEKKPEVIIKTIDNSNDSNQQPSKVQQTIVKEDCIKEVGPISISYPTEGQTITDSPTCITIKYPDSDYCSVVWSYRINGASWSDYSSNDVCLYNLPKGNIKVDFRVQSTASQDKTSLSRSFSFQGESSATSSAR